MSSISIKNTYLPEYFKNDVSKVYSSVITLRPTSDLFCNTVFLLGVILVCYYSNNYQ